jgi:phosphate transport system permease protein
MSTTATAVRPLVGGRRVERSTRALVFQAALLLCLLIGLLTLATLLVDVFTKGLPRLTAGFVSNLDSRLPSRAGIRPALVGTAWLMGLVAAIAFPIGLGAAVYLEEFAPKNKLTALLEVNIANLAGVPSIIYGLLGLAVFVRLMNMGRSILAGAMTLVLLILPVIIVAAREALRAVPDSIRQAALAVGATEWQTVWRQTLPAALPGTLTGLILGLSRAIGETAPLITLGALTYVNFVPSGPLDRFTAMPIQIFNWVSRPQSEYQRVAAAGIILLLVVLLAMNAFAIVLRNRYERKW